MIHSDLMLSKPKLKGLSPMKFKHKNHFMKRDFSPQTVRQHMIRNMHAQVLPLVVY